MSESEIKFKEILDKEQSILEKFAEKQTLLRKSVVEKSWEDLLCVMNEINVLSDSFQRLDEERALLANKMTAEELKNHFEQLSVLRRMLLKCKVENRALSQYIGTTRQFMDAVIEKTVPSAGTKTYSRNGMIRKPQPSSVIVNQMF